MPNSRLSVLLVEDNPDDADLLQRSLREARANISIEWVETLASGLALCGSQRFDLVLLDLSLPDSHGLPSVERALKQVPQLPIVVLTGLDDEDLGAAAVHAGAQDFLIKGRLDGRSLARSMAYAVERHRLVADLEQANAIQTYFAATMSHELRSTLFAIQGYAEMAAETVPAEDAEPQRLIRVIYERSREALALIQAALEVTRADVRPSELVPADIDVAELIGQLIAENPLPPERASLRLELEIPPDLPCLRSDSIKLSMILRNLISNALKFTEAGRIQVSVEAAGPGMRFVVADTGIGIGADELPHLFEPFRQAHGARSRRAGGSGLGLYIVARLADLLGGSISVDSTPGVGTSFSFSVPLAPPAISPP